jgi:hypothetical protein
MRIGAIPDLKLSQIQKIKEYDLYSISVMKVQNTSIIALPHQKWLKQSIHILEYRQRSGEKLTDVRLFSESKC